MKRIFLIVGISIIVLLAGILLFLLFASDSQKAGIFNRFDLANNESGESIIDEIVDTITGEDDPSAAALRQLTTKQVIGQVEIDQTASSTNTFVYFAEAGTGHIYSVDVVAGTETRLSNTTIQTASKVLFSRDGAYAVIASTGGRDGYQLTIVSLPRADSELSSLTLSEPVRDFSLTEDGFLLYSTVVADALAVRGYDLNKKESSTLFSLPFKEATVRVGNKQADSMLVYPKTTEKLESYLYLTKSGKLERLPIAGHGLNALLINNGVIYSKTAGDNYTSHIYRVDGTLTADLIISIAAEKCAATYLDTVVCGSNNNYGRGALEKGYKGALFVNDDLWLIDTNTYQVEKLVTPKELTGRDFDITTINTSRDLSRLYFINETDNSLWLFDRSISPVQ